jgi:hypothetical protein
MKKFGILLLITIVTLSSISCTEKRKKETKIKIEKQAVNANFDWLLGSWIRNNEEEGKETYEIWEKISPSEYAGIGFTMQNNDTLKQEKIKLINLDGKWNLEVQPQDEPEATTFKMTSYAAQEFICENKSLDFPKLIKYWKNGKKINALVAGDNMKISFEFERIIENQTNR